MESITNCCRLCLGEEEVEYDLFNSDNGRQSYFYQIFEMFGIELTNMDQWPSNGCVNCVRILDAVAELKDKVVTSQERLFDKIPQMKEECDPSRLVDCLMDEPMNIFDYKMDNKEEIQSIERDPQEDTASTPIVVKGDRTRFQIMTEAERLKKEEWIKESDELLRSLGLLQCSVCQLDLASFQELKQHLSLVHQIKRDHIPCCNRKYRLRSSYEHQRFKKHALSHQEKDGVQVRKSERDACPEEGATSQGNPPSKNREKGKRISKRRGEPEEDREQLESLMKDMDLLKCNVCRVAHSSFLDLRRHLEVTHAAFSGYIFCCQRKYTLRTAYEHMRYHQDQEAFKCTTCHRKFMCQLHLEKHLECNHVPADQALFRCEECGRGFAKAHYLHKHALQHQKGELRQSACSHCPGVFASRVELEEHVHGEHPGVQMYVCEFCGKGFLKKESMDHHLKVNHQQRTTEECDICGKHLFDLAIHKRRVHCTKRIPCEVCGREFNKRQLFLHMRKAHPPAGVRLKCSICHKEFANKSSHSNHMNRHLGKTYDCHFCPATNKDSGNLVKHMKLVHAVEYEEYRAQKLTVRRVKNTTT